MPASEAQIRANQQNALKSTGPKTLEGKAIARGNSLKHGMTGEALVVPVEDEAEVAQRFESFREELRPSGSLGLTLVRRAATMSVRMERGAERELAAITDRVVQAIADFEAPEDMDEAEAARLRIETARLAAFDTSKEACLARRYEAAAERSFYRALKEFRQIEKEARAAAGSPEINEALASLGSFCPDVNRPANPSPAPMINTRPFPTQTTQNPSTARTMPASTSFEVPIMIGRSR
jgi:hypothetical protein